MEQKKITEGNKLIAEFMGGRKSINEVYIFDNPVSLVSYMQAAYVDELKYNSSWDWLMPVVEKIEEICGIDLVEWDNSINEALSTKKISVLFAEVIEFINWYNKTQQL